MIRATQDTPTLSTGFRVRDCHPLRSDFPDCSTNLLKCDIGVLQPQGGRNLPGLGFSPFARHYLGNHVCFLFLPVLRCFSSRGSPPCLAWMTGRQPAGLPHSEIPGSKVVCTSPKLFAACHVLHRLPVPRHSPGALIRLTFCITLVECAAINKNFRCFPLKFDFLKFTTYLDIRLF